MTFPRPGRLRPLVACLVCALPLLSQQQQPPPQQKKNNPFEAVPQSPEQPQPPKLETPKPAVEQAQPGENPPEDVIENIEFRGARRVPADTLRALIFTKKGDKYDEETLHRDFMTLWNQGRFDDILLEREAGKTGWIVRFVLVERRVVRSIKYDGMKSITVSEILDRFKERKVGFSVESQYDPNKVQRARNVLQEYLSERGRQFATVEPEIRQVPPSSLEVTFKVNEGPKVKVGQINFDGNHVFSDRVVRRAMKNLRPIGIPHSILLEGMFAKSFDSTKLEEDQERIQDFYQSNGYFTARVIGNKANIVNVGGGKFRLPLIKPNRPGKNANIEIAIEEGRLYHLNTINFVGVKLFRTPDSLMRPVFQMGKGDVFSTAKLRKGFTELTKLYGQFGYIDFVAEPSFEPLANSDKIDLTLTFDEGKQFFVRRIDFSGNTTTRDKVIRRELLIDEGDIFNTRLWELSLLRLNQLGYFEVLKENEAADIKRDTKTDTVDITLKVKERGKNSISLNGGVSGIAGSFLGLNYSTNNLLGLGETLSLGGQVGTRMTNVTLGFTEPYFLDRPMQVGFSVNLTRFDYNQAREASVLSGTNLIALYNQLGTNNLLNYVSNSHGFSVFASYPLKRSFARVGITYGYNVQSIEAISAAAKTYFDYSNFLQINGLNQLNGISSSSITPSFTYNSVNAALNPTGGKSLSASLSFSGSILGGNVNEIAPVLDAKYFHTSPINKKHVIALHALGRWVTGYGGKVAPPFNRFYMGGENDIRGFDNWGISPIAYVPTSAQVPLANNDGSRRLQKTIDANGNPAFVAISQTVPTYQLVFPGGDTQVVANVEYRIPIFGPVTMALFVDAGANRLTRQSQLELNPDRAATLNSQFPEAAFKNRALISGGTQKTRMSTGVELQVLLPVVSAPFRIYWAYNPMRLDQYLVPPIVADRSYFPNAASFFQAVATIGQIQPFFEKASTFRFTVGRTF